VLLAFDAWAVMLAWLACLPAALPRHAVLHVPSNQMLIRSQRQESSACRLLLIVAGAASLVLGVFAILVS